MQQTFKYWIYANVRNGQVVYELSDIEWTSADCIRERVLIGEHTITHDLPEASKFTPLIVEKLQAKKQVMQATAAAAIAEVDGQIQNLLAIGHEVSHEAA